MTSNHNVFQDRHVRKQFNRLKGARNTKFGDFMGFEVLDGIILKADDTFSWRERAGNHIKQGGFTSPIGTDDGFDDTAFDLKIKVNQGRKSAKGHNDIFHFKDILCTLFVQRWLIS